MSTERAPGGLVGGGWLPAARRAVWPLAIAYAVGLAGLAVLVRMSADRWWFMTPVVYGPMWVFAVPLGVLVPATVWAGRRGTWGVLGVSALLLAHLMGLRVHWPRSGPTPRDEITLLTCNVDEKSATAAALLEIVGRRNVDVVALQECPPVYPMEGLTQQGWQVRSAGDLCVASRFPIRAVDVMPYEIAWRHPMMRVDVETPRGLLRVYCLHLNTPRKDSGEDVKPGRARVRREKTQEESTLEGLGGRRRQAEEVAAAVVREPGPGIILGDFNLVEGSAIFRDCFGQYTDAFAATGMGLGHTRILPWWGARIDHLLCNEGLRPTSCEVMGDVGSDHLPVVATFAFTGFVGSSANGQTASGY